MSENFLDRLTFVKTCTIRTATNMTKQFTFTDVWTIVKEQMTLNGYIAMELDKEDVLATLRILKDAKAIKSIDNDRYVRVYTYD